MNPYILYNLHSEGTITNSTQHSPSLEDGSSSASQEIPCLLPNSKVHYHIHNSLPPVPVLSQINPDHASTRLPSGLFPSDFLNKTLYAPVLSGIHATCPTNNILNKF